ncbi:hypothetical protein [Virgibacillus dokdonensis]|uniref:hypothetical protein n=1 Tax=Virgibacillus dokdonensis TaxID=302167 RepID=UPI00098A957D|nr:hypothetical protein [Virgibacillus dokdonensis]
MEIFQYFMKNSKTIIAIISFLLTLRMFFIDFLNRSMIVRVLEDKNKKMTNNLFENIIFSFSFALIVTLTGYQVKINYNISDVLLIIMAFILFVTLIVLIVMLIISSFRKIGKCKHIIYCVSLCVMNFLVAVTSENIMEVKDLLPLVLLFGFFYLMIFTSNLLNGNVTSTSNWETNIILNSINSRLSQLVLLYNLSNGKQIYVEKKDIGKKEHELHTFYVFYKTEKYLQCYTLYDDVKETNKKKKIGSY